MKKKLADSMYQGSEEFTFEQVAFAAQCILAGALDMIDGGSPLCMSFSERKACCTQGVEQLNAYERGCLDSAGMALSILYAQLTGDGMGAGDALTVAGNFDEAIEDFVYTAWKDGGEEVLERERTIKKPCEYCDLFVSYPNTRVHALFFAKEVFEVE